jgi:hypothetical protein
MNTLSLKELERKAFKSTFQDGIWDIYLGLLLLQIGFGPGLMATGFSIAVTLIVCLSLVTVAMVFFFMGKKKITTPRLGLIKVGPARKKNLKKVMFMMTLSAILGVIFFIFQTKEIIYGIPIPIIVFGFMCLIGFSLGAYYLSFERLYFYGFLYAFAFPLSIILKNFADFKASFLVVYSVSSGIMLLIGIILFIQFLNKFPKENISLFSTKNQTGV